MVGIELARDDGGKYALKGNVFDLVEGIDRSPQSFAML
jgi:hypothetical protein